jgi:cytidylate kinase
MSNDFFVITISHQLGSGGSYIGTMLSKRLGMPFIDRDILKQVADQLHLSENELENREERLSSFWESFTRMAVYSDPGISLTTSPYVLSDQNLFQLESEYIKRITEKTSAVILGRCGQYILRDHPHHFSVMVHADPPARISRIRDLYKLSETDAKKMIEANDKERAAYIHTFTKQDWLNTRLYDLCVNTSHVGLDTSVELVAAGIAAKIHS